MRTLQRGDRGADVLNIQVLFKKLLRGKDEWVRIFWDEALDIVASEIKRIKKIRK